MSVEVIIPTTDSETSSRTASTHCTDSDSERGRDSRDNHDSHDSDCLKRGDVKTCSEEKQKKKSSCCGSVSQCVTGVLLVIMSISGFIFTPLDFMLWEKLNMRPGLPPYEWWAVPPDEVRLRAHVFNYTNHERFLSGADEKLDVRDLGPVVYLEKLQHSNIRFNDNDTLTYTARRYPIYLPEENHLDLNSTIFVPNMAVLGLASYLHNAPFFVKTAFSLIVKTHQSKFFVKKTIYEYLWDFTDPVLDTSKRFVPGLVPVNNMGILARVSLLFRIPYLKWKIRNPIYGDFTDEMTVKIGPRWGHEHFFQIDRFRGEPQLPGYDADSCPDRISGSTEGVMYRQRLTKQDVLLYWRKTVCKLMPLYFDSELQISSVPVYRYNLSESVYERVTNGTDCYDTVPTLPAGVSDASRCYFDYPMVVSYPHFYTGGVPAGRFVTGLTPDREKHNSFAVVEPLTGIPFHSVARMQSNLRMYDVAGFGSQYRKFSNLVIPLFWAEYNQESLPARITWMVYFTVVVLPPLSQIMLAFTLILGSYLITKNVIHHTKIKNDTLKTLLLIRSKNVNTIAKNRIFSYEKESFLKRPS